MSRPVLFVIDDDAGVVRALRDDLAHEYLAAGRAAELSLLSRG